MDSNENDARQQAEPVVPVGRLGQYELFETLGEGGMGTVYKARHTRLNQIVAVKVLREDLHQDSEAASRFHREMEVLGRLDHPNIVRAADAGEASGVHYLVTEFVDGIDLGRLVDAQGPLPVADACEVIRQAALGLQHAHELELVHRDIKPANLMVTPDGQVKVLDLGLARLQGEHSTTTDLTATGQVLGTLDYMAPEQTDNVRGVDIRSDIYSLGCTLYKLLTGQAPFASAAYNTPAKKTIAHALRKPPDLAKFRTDVPDGVSDVLGRMLAKEPRDRFETPAELVEAITPFIDGCHLAELVESRHVTPGTDAETANNDNTTDRQPDAAKAPSAPPTFAQPISRPVIAVVGLLVLMGGLWFAGSRPGLPGPGGDDANGPSQSVDADSRDETSRFEPQTIDLFNGQDLTNWVIMRSSAEHHLHEPAPGTDDWVVRNGVLVCNTATPGWLKSKRPYGDFVLELEFKLPERGNSGVYLRSPGAGWLSKTGMEVQVIEESTWGSELDPDNRTGAVQRMAGHDEAVQKPVGEWNSMEMRCEGPRVQVTLNGTQVVDTDISAADRPQSGFIGLANWQGQAIGAEFRNIRIRELSPYVPSLPPSLVAAWTSAKVAAVLVPEPQSVPGIHRWQMDTVYPRGGFLAVAWHPTKPWIACGTRPGQVRVYDADDGTLLQLLIDTHEQHLIRNLAWSPDGRFLAVARNQGVGVWDVESWEQSQITGRGGVAWSPDSNRLAVGLWDGAARICTLDDTTEVEFEIGSAIRSIAWSRDGNLIAVGCRDGNITVWEADGTSGPLLERLHKAPIHSLSFNHDTTILVSSSNNGVGDHPLVGGAAASLKRGQATSLVSWNPQDNRLARASSNGSVHLRNADQSIGPVLKAPSLPIRNTWGTAFAWNPAGDRIAVGCIDTGLRIWDGDGFLLQTISSPAGLTLDVDWNSETGLVLAAGNQTPLRTWMIDGHSAGRIGQTASPFRHCEWSPDGTQILAVQFHRKAQILSRDGLMAAEIDFATAACWHPTDDAVIVADGYGTIRIHATDGSEIAVLGEHRKGTLFASNPRYNLLATAASDNKVCLWNLDESTRTVLDGRGVTCQELAWSLDGEWLASFGTGRNVELWNKDGTAAAPLQSTSAFTTGCWMPMNRLLTTTLTFPARFEGLTPPLDVAPAGEPSLEGLDDVQFRGHSVAVNSMEAVEPGARIVSCSSDNTVRLWNVERGEEEWIGVMLPEGKSVTIDRAGKILDRDTDVEKHLVFVVEREPGQSELMKFDEFHELASPAMRHE